MMPTDPNPVAEEIGRLEQDIHRTAADSRHALDRALQAAWQIGTKLYQERDRLRLRYRRAAWTAEVQKHYLASEPAARRYMELAFAFPDPSQLSSLSTRRVYYYLNITTEPAARSNVVRFRPTPTHVGRANRLVVMLRRKLHNGLLSSENRRLLREDLAPLHEQLQRLFAEDPRPFRSAA